MIEQQNDEPIIASHDQNFGRTGCRRCHSLATRFTLFESKHYQGILRRLYGVVPNADRGRIIPLWGCWYEKMNNHHTGMLWLAMYVMYMFHGLYCASLFDI